MTTVKAKVLYSKEVDGFLTHVNRYIFYGELPQLFRDNISIETIRGLTISEDRDKLDNYELIEVVIIPSDEYASLMSDAAREDEAGKWEAQLKSERERAGKLLEALKKCLEATKELNGEYQDGWDDEIEQAETAINEYNNKP